MESLVLGWDVTQAAAAHAGLAGVLAGIVLIVLPVVSRDTIQGSQTPEAHEATNLPSASTETGPTDQSEVSALDKRLHMLRLLVLAMIYLVLSAVLWGGLSGHPHIENLMRPEQGDASVSPQLSSLPPVDSLEPLEPQGQSEAIGLVDGWNLYVGKQLGIGASAVILLATGALALIAGVFEAVSSSTGSTGLSTPTARPKSQKGSNLLEVTMFRTLKWLGVLAVYQVAFFTFDSAFTLWSYESNPNYWALGVTLAMALLISLSNSDWQPSQCARKRVLKGVRRCASKCASLRDRMPFASRKEAEQSAEVAQTSETSDVDTLQQIQLASSVVTTVIVLGYYTFQDVPRLGQSIDAVNAFDNVLVAALMSAGVVFLVYVWATALVAAPRFPRRSTLRRPAQGSSSDCDVDRNGDAAAGNRRTAE